MGLPECYEVYRLLPTAKKAAAKKFLYELISEKDKKQLRKEIKKDPIHWFTPYHFHWGMNIRNSLRHGGFGEEYFFIKNLDDIYVELVEDTVKEDKCKKE